MKSALKLVVVAVWISAFGSSQAGASERGKVIELWPAAAPGEKGDIGQEQNMTRPDGRLVAGKPVIRLGNVSKPTITIYRPSAKHNTGTAIMICPGGAYSIVATDLEGTEVCKWLNSIGITGVILKYRVPKREGDDAHVLPLQDAQRALGLIRHQAKQWGIKPDRIGALGFSAGGHLVASLSNNYGQRRYPKVDEADAASCRPDFTLLMYPAYLLESKDSNKLAPEMKITEQTPPTFIAMAADDKLGIANALYYSLTLTQAKVPFELHVYSTGGHGFGLRPQKGLPASSWPQRAAEWLATQKLLER
jgi:acetyl esterase/lipase